MTKSLRFTLDPSDLKKMLHYEPSTGVLTWNMNWGRRYKKGDRLKICAYGRNKGDGVRLNGSVHAYHRIVVYYMTGENPKKITHVNGVGSDHRWCNLTWKGKKSEQEVNFY